MPNEFTGSLTERLAVEHWLDLRDEAAAAAGAWEAWGTVFAAVAADGHGRTAEGEARRLRPRYHVTLRAPFAVDLLTRFIWRGQVLSVIGVEADPLLPDRVAVRVEARGAGA